MRLSELAGGLGVIHAATDPEITGISEDSRRIVPGALFVAIPGTSLDGHDFVADALARGAAAVVVQDPARVPGGISAVHVPDARQAAARLAARFYGTSSIPLAIVGFTGTFGKTSTSEILRALLDAGGMRAGVVGSLGARYGTFADPGSGLTTPTPVELHRTLRALYEAGAATVIMEVTSHALKLGRVAGLQFAGGLLAAIMPGEHTDFHRSYRDYVAAKRLFLEYLAPGATLAFDADNRAARRLASGAAGHAISFSTEGRESELQLSDVVLDPAGAAFTIGGALADRSGAVRVQSSLLGRGHLRNVALALTYALNAGIPIRTAGKVLKRLRPLRRRMEHYDLGGRRILDDTAAHPDSLRATFEVAALLASEPIVVMYALRGNRGADINRRNAVALADLCDIHRVRSLIVTASAEAVGAADRASTEEVDATREALDAQGQAFTWHDTLRAAATTALDVSRAGDLIVLLGAQGMNEGQRALVEVADR